MTNWRHILLVLAGCLAVSSTAEVVSEHPQRTERMTVFWWCEAPDGKRLAREVYFTLEGVDHPVGAKEETLWSEPPYDGNSGYGGY